MLWAWFRHVWDISPYIFPKFHKTIKQLLVKNMKNQRKSIHTQLGNPSGDPPERSERIQPFILRSDANGASWPQTRARPANGVTPAWTRPPHLGLRGQAGWRYRSLGRAGALRNVNTDAHIHACMGTSMHTHVRMDACMDACVHGVPACMNDCMEAGMHALMH